MPSILDELDHPPVPAAPARAAGVLAELDDPAGTFLRAAAARGVPLEEATTSLKGLGFTAGVNEGAYRLESARARAAGEERPWAVAVGEKIPGAGTAGKFLLEREYGIASRRVAEGKGRKKGEGGNAYDDFDLVAQYERLQQIEKERSLAGAVGQTVAGLPALYYEAAGGAAALRGLKILGRGKQAQVAAERATNAELGRGLANRGARALGDVAGATAAAPVFYAQDAAKNFNEALAKGRGETEALARGLGAALTYGVAQNAIVGQLLKPATAGRASAVAKKAPLAFGEQQVVDLAAGALDLKTGYGVLGNLARGESGEAMKAAASQLVTFGLFAGLHGRSVKAELKPQIDLLNDLVKRRVPPNEAALELRATIPQPRAAARAWEREQVVGRKPSQPLADRPIDTWHIEELRSEAGRRGLPTGGTRAELTQLLSRPTGPEPIRAYHGTSREFADFDTGRAGENIDLGFFGEGTYFTTQPELAKYYARSGQGREPTAKRVVHEVELDLKNPYDFGVRGVPHAGTRGEAQGFGGEPGKGIPTKDGLREAVYKRAGLEPLSGDKAPDGSFITDYTREHQYERKLAKALREELVARGHDGAVITHPDGSKEYVVFEGSRAKIRRTDPVTLAENPPGTMPTAEPAARPPAGPPEPAPGPIAPQRPSQGPELRLLGGGAPRPVPGLQLGLRRTDAARPVYGESAPGGARVRSGPMFDLVKDAGLGERVQKVEDDLAVLGFGDRFVLLQMSQSGRLDLSFAFEKAPVLTQGAREIHARGPTMAAGGNPEFVGALKSIVAAAGKKGVGIEYNASTSPNTNKIGQPTKTTRASVYERMMREAGFEKVSEKKNPTSVDVAWEPPRIRPPEKPQPPEPATTSVIGVPAGHKSPGQSVALPVRPARPDPRAGIGAIWRGIVAARGVRVRPDLDRAGQLEADMRRAKLSDREKLVLRARLLGEEPRAHQDIADELGLKSRERVRQIEADALKKIGRKASVEKGDLAAERASRARRGDTGGGRLTEQGGEAGYGKQARRDAIENLQNRIIAEYEAAIRAGGDKRELDAKLVRDMEPAALLARLKAGRSGPAETAPTPRPEAQPAAEGAALADRLRAAQAREGLTDADVDALVAEAKALPAGDAIALVEGLTGQRRKTARSALKDLGEWLREGGEMRLVARGGEGSATPPGGAPGPTAVQKDPFLNARVSHEAAVARIGPGRSEWVAGHLVRRTAEGFQVETPKGYKTGTAAEVSDLIRDSWRRGAAEGKGAHKALQRAAGFEEPSWFGGGRAAEVLADRKRAVPDGTRGVSLEPNTYGRVGRVEGGRLVLDDGRDTTAGDYEPIPSKYSWRTEAGVARVERRASVQPKLPTMAREDMLADVVRRYGGIDPESHSLKTFFSGVGEAREGRGGLAVPGVFRKGGRGLDQMAQELHAAGHLKDPSPETLVEALRRNEPSRAADTSRLDEARIAEDDRRRQEEADRSAAEAREADRGPAEGEPIDLSFEFGELIRPVAEGPRGPTPANLPPPPGAAENRVGGVPGPGGPRGVSIGPTARAGQPYEFALAGERVAAERALRDLPPVLRDMARSNPEGWRRAVAEVGRNADAGRLLVERLEADPDTLRPDADVPLLLLHRVALSNAHERARDEFNAEGEATDIRGRVIRPANEAAQAALERRMDDLAAERDRLDRVTSSFGSKLGRGLAFFRQLAREDYSLSTLMGRARVAKGGKPLTPEEKATVTRVADEIKAATEALTDLEAGKTQPRKVGERGDPTDIRVRVRKSRVAAEDVIADLKLKSQSAGRRAFEAAKDGANASRALITAYDLSALGRQGGFFTFARPLTTARAIPDMLRALVSERAQERQQEEILQRENSVNGRYGRMELYLAETDGSLLRREEAFMSRLVRNLPTALGRLVSGGVKASERAYVSLLNRVRADVADSMAAATRNGRPTLAEERAIGNMINVATGRGPLGSLERVASNLSTVFFSPRYVASRFQLLLGQPFMQGSAATRKLFAAEYARAAVGVGVFYALMAAANDDMKLTFDPRSADFGKVVLGRTRIDPLAGLAQVTTFLGRLGTSTAATLTGNKRLGQSVPPAELTAGRFVRGKLAPVPGVAADVVTGKTLEPGKKVTLGREAGQLTVPIAFRDVAEVMEKEGMPRSVVVSILGVLGMGARVHERQAGR